MKTIKAIKAWTRQVPAVAEELERTGRYVVREEYIRIKNDTIADYYLDMYRWYTKKARAYVDIPEANEYPIWFSLSEEFRLQQIPDTVVLQVDIPIDKCMIIDAQKWDYRGNDMYVPTDRADRERFEKELKKYGIGDETALVESAKGNFYPLLRNEIINSWDRIFAMPPKNQEEGFATSWEIRSEWVKEVRYSE